MDRRPWNVRGGGGGSLLEIKRRKVRVKNEKNN